MIRATATRDPALLAAAAELRREVFVDEQGVDPNIERDGADPSAIHVVALAPTGAVVGTGRLVDAGDHARLGRIAVRRADRGQGIAPAVVRALEDSAAGAGLPLIRLHSQQPVTGFYRFLEYDEDGPPDVEAGLPHQWMRRDLLPGLRPAGDADSGALVTLVGGCYAEYPGCVLDPAGVDAW
ncbi:MAG: GNAT family N-acetyltransferase, partial [Mycobacteriales bacterium]